MLALKTLIDKVRKIGINGEKPVYFKNGKWTEDSASFNIEFESELARNSFFDLLVDALPDHDIITNGTKYEIVQNEVDYSYYSLVDEVW